MSNLRNKNKFNRIYFTCFCIIENMKMIMFIFIYVRRLNKTFLFPRKLYLVTIQIPNHGFTTENRLNR